MDVIKELDAIRNSVRLLTSKQSDADATIFVSDLESESVRDVIREELAKFGDDLIGRLPALQTSVTFADAVKRPKVKTPVSRLAIVLESADPDVKTSADVVSVWKKSVSFKDSTFAPARVQPVSNGKVRVEFDNVQ